MLSINPRFILRQWVLEEVIARLGKDGSADGDGGRFLNRILGMCERPFEGYGEEFFVGDGGEGRGEEEARGMCPTEGAREEMRVCEVGDELMHGFQCSCSS